MLARLGASIRAFAARPHAGRAFALGQKTSFSYVMRITATLLVATCAAAASPNAAVADCPAIVNATMKTAVTPYHMVMERDDPAHRHNEMIQTADTSYMLIKDKWRAVPYNPQERVKDLKESAKDQKITCQSLGRDSIDGQRTEHYSAHTESNEAGSSSGEIWISVDTGLVLQERLIHSEDGRKTTTNIKFDYTNVSPPAGATPLARGKP
jgi:hypothetical protein